MSCVDKKGEDEVSATHNTFIGRSLDGRHLHTLFIQTRAADGSNEAKRFSQFSQSLQAVAACATTLFVAWETVLQLTHILPHHDCRNVGSALLRYSLSAALS